MALNKPLKIVTDSSNFETEDTLANNTQSGNYGILAMKERESSSDSGTAIGAKWAFNGSIMRGLTKNEANTLYLKQLFGDWELNVNLPEVINITDSNRLPSMLYFTLRTTAFNKCPYGDAPDMESYSYSSGISNIIYTLKYYDKTAGKEVYPKCTLSCNGTTLLSNVNLSDFIMGRSHPYIELDDIKDIILKSRYLRFELRFTKGHRYSTSTTTDDEIIAVKTVPIRLPIITLDLSTNFSNSTDIIYNISLSTSPRLLMQMPKIGIDQHHLNLHIRIGTINENELGSVIMIPVSSFYHTGDGVISDPNTPLYKWGYDFIYDINSGLNVTSTLCTLNNDFVDNNKSFTVSFVVFGNLLNADYSVYISTMVMNKVDAERLLNSGYLNSILVPIEIY